MKTQCVAESICQLPRHPEVTVLFVALPCVSPLLVACGSSSDPPPPPANTGIVQDRPIPGHPTHLVFGRCDIARRVPVPWEVRRHGAVPDCVCQDECPPVTGAAVPHEHAVAETWTVSSATPHSPAGPAMTRARRSASPDDPCGVGINRDVGTACLASCPDGIREPRPHRKGLAWDRGTEVALAVGDPCGIGCELRRTGLHVVPVAYGRCRRRRHATRARPNGERVRSGVVQSGVVVVDRAPPQHQPGQHDRRGDPGPPGAVRRPPGPADGEDFACRHLVTATQAATAPLRIKSPRRSADNSRRAAYCSAAPSPSAGSGVVAPTSAQPSRSE